MNREDVIRLAKEAGIGVEDDSSVPVWHMSVDYLERFATLAIAPHQKRADALAETIVALRCVVTDDTETKSDFIARVKAILSACPDTRVLQAVLDEREALEKELLKLKDGIASNREYIQGRWDLIDEFQDVIRAGGKE